MPNPATTLADLLDQWHIPNNTNVAGARGCKDAGDLDFWRSQVQAVELLAEVDRSLDALEDLGEEVAYLRNDLVPLYHAVFGYSPIWRRLDTNQRRAEPSAPPEAIRMLRMLGMMINRYLATALKPETADRLLELLDEAAGLVAQLDADDRTKHYLFDLIADARRGVQEADLFGAARVRSSYMALTTELNGQAAATQNQSPELARKVFAWVGAAALAMGTAFGTGVGGRAADWVLDKASEIHAIAPASEESDVADAEIVEERSEGS
jgi:hypothetical protein